MPKRKDLTYAIAVLVLVASLVATWIGMGQFEDDVDTRTDHAKAATGIAPAPDDTETALAFAELLEMMQRKSALFSDPRWGLRTDDTVAEGRLMLLHMFNHALDVHLGADPERPVFQSWLGPYKKLLGDNPNAMYYDAAVDARWRYRITGNIGEATYTSFTVELAKTGAEGLGRLGATLNDAQVDIADDGSYEIVVSAQQPAEAGNWLRLDPGAISITTRHYYETEHNVGNIPNFAVDMRIEPLQEPGATPLPTDASVSSGIRRAARWVERNLYPPLPERSPHWVSQVPNEFSEPVRDKTNQAISYAAADNVYAMARWQLGPDEALVISGRFPDCRFANVVLWNDYMQTLPFRYRQISLNRKQTVLEPDGSFRVIVAHRDPGQPNWLDTGGREEGVMFWRFMLPTEPITALETERVSLAEL